MIDITNPKVLAPVVSLIGLLFFVWAIRHPRTKLILGPPADFWELIRRYGLPILGKRLPDRIYTTGTVTKAQSVGVSNLSTEVIETRLWNVGFRRMPLAAYKESYDGRKEVGSWAYRDGLLAETQLHITLVEHEHGTEIFAHSEPNAINPFTAYRHFASNEVDAKDGVEQAKNQLPDLLF